MGSKEDAVNSQLLWQKEQVRVEHQNSLYEFIMDGYKNCLMDSKNCTNFNALCGT